MGGGSAGMSMTGAGVQGNDELSSAVAPAASAQRLPPLHAGMHPTRFLSCSIYRVDGVPRRGPRPADLCTADAAGSSGRQLAARARAV